LTDQPSYFTQNGVFPSSFFFTCNPISHLPSSISMAPDKEVDKAAVKALVTVYGPREAARIAKLPPGTVMAWAHRYKWKKVTTRPVGVSRDSGSTLGGKDAADALAAAMESSKVASTLHLAKYTEKASKAAAEHEKPLDVARKVRDVAGVYSTLWPAEEHSELIDGGILLGTEAVTENPEEMKALAEDVRAELQDQRQAGD
jgi:hypothetical protein